MGMGTARLVSLFTLLLLLLLLLQMLHVFAPAAWPGTPVAGAVLFYAMDPLAASVLWQRVTRDA